jgi:hypothetical protein
MPQSIDAVARNPPASGTFHAVTAGTAVVAAAAAEASLAADFPVWAMFIGWVAFYTRGVTARDGVFNYLCTVLGMLIGGAAAIAIGMLGPSLGGATLPIVVFVVAMLVVSMRAVPRLNNLLGYFLGLIAFFAAHQAPSLAIFATLAGAIAVGCIAACMAHLLQRRLA